MTQPHHIHTEDEWMSILLKEWHTKNEKPLTDFSRGSHFMAWWRCSICSHEWQTTIKNRRLLRSKCLKCKNVKHRGNGNPRWNGFEDITGRQWCILKREAARRNIPFDITIQDAWNIFILQSKKCALTGKPLTMYRWEDHKNVGNASLDRIDSTKGYYIENVQWIDKKLQPVKLNLQQIEFIKICKDVAGHKTEKSIASRLQLPLAGAINEEHFAFTGNKHPQWAGCGEMGQTMWYRITENAKKRNIAVEITIDYCWNLFLHQDRKCALTGKVLIMRYHKGRTVCGNASLDRIDSSKGYVSGNVQWIDKKLQHVKTKLSDAEFIAICQKVAAYQLEKLGIPSFKQWATKV